MFSKTCRNCAKWIPAVFLAALLLACVGCGSNNVDACKLYVESLNAERKKCGTPELNPATECPESLNHGGADCTDYYECNATAYQCDAEEGTVKANEELQAQCDTGCV